jgi:hypothetical protein
LDKNALICDFAETYNLYDFKLLPPEKVAVLAIGLRDDSRIKMKKAGIKQPINTLLLAAAVDRLSVLVWSKTKDAQNGSNRPVSIFAKLVGIEKDNNIKSYDSAEEFEKARQRIVGGR